MPKRVFCYHRTEGPVEMVAVDAKEAAKNHPDEWSLSPWEGQRAPAPEATPEMLSRDQFMSPTFQQRKFGLEHSAAMVERMSKRRQ